MIKSNENVRADSSVRSEAKEDGIDRRKFMKRSAVAAASAIAGTGLVAASGALAQTPASTIIGWDANTLSTHIKAKDVSCRKVRRKQRRRRCSAGGAYASGGRRQRYGRVDPQPLGILQRLRTASINWCGSLLAIRRAFRSAICHRGSDGPHRQGRCDASLHPGWPRLARALVGQP